MARRRFSPTDAVVIGRALAEALDYLHRRGIHRLYDLKPQNIMLQVRDDEPLIVDFGLSSRIPRMILTLWLNLYSARPGIWQREGYRG